MYEIPVHEPSEEFARCWQAAGLHIQGQVQGTFDTWLKADLAPPFLEHLSFRLGNQLFFVRIEDLDGRLQVPGSPIGLLSVADGCEGHACRMPMRRGAHGWEPVLPGWGLEGARTGLPVDPPSLVTDELIEMTRWELQDLAVQVVRDWLEDEGRQLMSAQGDPKVDPSIWFVGDDGPEWVVVRAVRYPESEAAPPRNWADIARACRRLSGTGHFASVAVANGDDPLDAPGAPIPLWRGHGMHIHFPGLVPGATIAVS